MKRLLSIIGAISLVGTSTTSLVACELKNILEEYTKEELIKLKEENKINTANKEIRDNLEWIEPQEKPFNTVDNKYYFVIWRGNENNDWRIIKFKNNAEQRKKQILENYKNFRLILHNQKVLYIIEIGKNGIPWSRKNFNYFKLVYRWNLNTKEPDLIIDDNDNVKINGE